MLGANNLAPLVKYRKYKFSVEHENREYHVKCFTFPDMKEAEEGA